MKYIIVFSRHHHSNESKSSEHHGGLFSNIKENQASYFKNYRLLYIHCVAKDDFEISLAYVACVKMICREIHVSFVDKMNERRVALVPRIVDKRNVDDIFKDATSPVLIRINSSCDTKVS